MEEAYFHVTQFRGFEKFCEGRPFYEMPGLMVRICGICPVAYTPDRKGLVTWMKTQELAAIMQGGHLR